MAIPQRLLAPSGIELTCPRCRGALEPHADSLVCPICPRHYPVVDGVPHFVTGDGYWGEIPLDDMQALLDSMQQMHWLEALEQSASVSIRAKRSFIADHRRANWVFELPLDSSSRVLDVGCGMGSISAELAEHVGEVVGLEAVELRAAFCATRFAQDQLDNVQVVRADALEPPFPDGTFDAVLLNGVLEWLGRGRTEDVREVQLEALRLLRRILRPDGYLIVAIENRWAVGSFRGRIDHSYLRFTSIMPRWLADVVTRARRGHRYDTYTYGHPGYTRLLAEAGFDQTRTLLPVWGYNNPAYFVPLSERVRPTAVELLGLTGGREARFPLVRKLERSLRLSRHFPEDYLFLARQGIETRRSWLHQHLAHRWHQWQLAGDPNDLEMVYHNGAIPTALVFAAGAPRPQAVVKLAPTAPAGSFSAPAAEIAALRDLRQTFCDCLLRRVPEPLDLARIDGHEVAIMSYLAGSHIGLPPDPADAGATLQALALHAERAVDWLDHAARCRTTPAAYVDADHIESHVVGAAAHLGDGGAQLEAAALAHMRRRWPHAGFRMRHARQHGDFALANLVEVDGAFGVVDWERFDRVQLPFFDCLHFAINLMLMAVSDKHGWRPADSILQLLEPSSPGSAVRAAVDPYLRALGVDPDTMDVLLIASLLAYVREYGADPRRRGMMRVAATQLHTALHGT